jgi:hypothetical protein
MVLTQSVDFERGSITTVETTLADLIETLAYEALAANHSGWENNDGGYGQFQFCSVEQSIKLEFWERYTETNYHEHEI